MTDLNATHDPSRRSVIAAANAPDTDFPIQNLPFGRFSRTADGPVLPGVAIGDHVLDLAAALGAGAFSGEAERAARAAVDGQSLNDLLALGNGAASALRARLADLLDAAGGTGVDLGAALVPMSRVTLHLPSQVRNFTDFLTSASHFRRLGATGELTPAFMSLPLAYHSRASSVTLGGEVPRPHVQSSDGDTVRFAPTAEMDFELEVGAYVGTGNAQGDPIRIGDAPDHIFGFCLLNDWSVRDIQRWESVPLGPFQAKSLSTMISPWIVTEEALRPFRTAAETRGEGELAPLPHLSHPDDQRRGGYDITLQALISTAGMRAAGAAPHRITATNLRHLYWTFAQMFAHHTGNGCNLQPGDLLASGTVSGPEPGERACLAEITRKGRDAFSLPNGETRTWLEDGDEITFTGRAVRDGFAPIGFGTCTGRLTEAVAY